MQTTKVLLATDLGFCSGVRRAVLETERNLARHSIVASTDALLHNVREMSRLRSLGLRSFETLSREQLAETTVVLPAHGSTGEERAMLARSVPRVVDLTCPIVNAARQRVEELVGAGLPVLIVGDGEHRETRYLMEGAGDSLVGVVGSVDDMEHLLRLPSRAGLVCQTTQTRENRDRILAWLTAHDVDVVETSTLCPEVLRRQSSIAVLAAACSAVLVLGDASSANARRSVLVASRHCSRAFLVSDAASVRSLGLVRSDTIGIASGTSCPDYAIRDALDVLTESLGKLMVSKEPQQRDSV